MKIKLSILFLIVSLLIYFYIDSNQIVVDKGAILITGKFFFYMNFNYPLKKKKINQKNLNRMFNRYLNCFLFDFEIKLKYEKKGIGRKAGKKKKKKKKN